MWLARGLADQRPRGNQLLYDAAYREAQEENSKLLAAEILEANIAAGQKTLELDRKWRESITVIGLEAFTEKLNEVQEVRPRPQEGG